MATFEDLFRSETGLDQGQQEAILRKVYKAAGDEQSETTRERIGELLSDEYQVVLVERILKMFDQHGRRIPPQGIQATVVDANYAFYLTQPEIDHVARLALITKHLCKGDAFMSPEDFKSRSDAILALIAGDKRTVNISKGVHLPIALPKMDITAKTYGEVLDEKIMPAVEAAYLEQYPERKFYNHRKGDLAGKVTIVKGSRHEQFLDAINDGPVVLMFFATALQGYSIEADVEQMADMPEPVLLGGAIEPAAGLIAYAEVLARDYQTPGLDAAALRWQSAEHSLFFKAHVEDLDFDYRVLRAYDNYSASLAVLG